MKPIVPIIEGYANVQEWTDKRDNSGAIDRALLVAFAMRTPSKEWNELLKQACADVEQDRKYTRAKLQKIIEGVK